MANLNYIFLLFFLSIICIQCKDDNKKIDAAALGNAQNRMEQLKEKYNLKNTDITLNYEGIEDKVRSGDTSVMYKEFEEFLQKIQKEETESAARAKFYEEVVKPAVDRAKTKEEFIEVAKKYPDYVQMPE
jgi:hypothetical protein